MFDFTIETLPCPSCGASTEAARFARTKAVLFLCDACAAADAGRRRHEDRRMQCLELWRDCTPADFQIPLREAEISPDLLPVLKMPGTEGIGLIGPCRAGKTRVAYRLLKKAAAAGLKPYAITASAYRQAVRDATCDDRDAKGRARTALSADGHRIEVVRNLADALATILTFYRN